jgi:hypothetical protein
MQLRDVDLGQRRTRSTQLLGDGSPVDGEPREAVSRDQGIDLLQEDASCILFVEAQLRGVARDERPG